MKYALLIYSSPELRDIPEDQLKSVVGEYEDLRSTECSTAYGCGNGLGDDRPRAERRGALGDDVRRRGSSPDFTAAEADHPRRGDGPCRACSGGPWAARLRCVQSWSDRRACVVDEVFRDGGARPRDSSDSSAAVAAEEATQEAFAVAAERRATRRHAAQPGAWLDHRSQPRNRPRPTRCRARRGKTKLLEAQQAVEAAMEGPSPRSVVSDRRLELIFTCCHPALRSSASGADPASTGRAHDRRDRPCLPRRSETMKRRLSRAKRRDLRGGRDPVRRAARPPSARAARCGARRRLPDLQRGIPQRALTRIGGDSSRQRLKPS